MSGPFKIVIVQKPALHLYKSGNPPPFEASGMGHLMCQSMTYLMLINGVGFPPWLVDVPAPILA